MLHGSSPRVRDDVRVPPPDGVGGSIANPTSKVVALKGMWPSAMPIQLKLDSFEDQDEVKVPTWANIKK
eukprot:2962495-Ditylum_brightwellii.AAC.1